MKQWSYWFPDVLPHVAGCPQPIAEHEIRRTAQAFFEQTKAWRIQADVLPITAGTETVPIAPTDTSLELVQLEDNSVYYDGRELVPATPEVLAHDYPQDWRTETPSTPKNYYQLQPGILRLHPIPAADSAQGLVWRMFVRPSDESTGLPDEIALKFRDAIYIGARARLMLYANVPWSNPQLAAEYGSAFSAAVQNAKELAARAYVQARITARSRRKWC